MARQNAILDDNFKDLPPATSQNAIWVDLPSPISRQNVVHEINESA